MKRAVFLVTVLSMVSCALMPTAFSQAPATAQSAAAAALPTATDLVMRSIRATGDEATLARLLAGQTKSRGTFANGVRFTQEAVYQLPDQLKQIQTIEGDGRRVMVTLGLNQAEGWMVDKEGKTYALAGALLMELQEAMHLVRITRLVPLLKDQAFQLTVLHQPDPAGGYGVHVACRGHRDVDLFFDPRTGLLSASGRRVPDSSGRKEVYEQRHYREYKKIDAILTPARVTVYRDSQQFMTAELLEANYRESLDPNMFRRP